MKPILLVLALALFVSATAAPGAASAQTIPEPETLLQTWLAALADADHATYSDCLYSESRSVPEYGSEGAMRFWTEQIEQLRKRGFAGRFEIEVVTNGGPRLPPGTLLAHPILDGKPIADSIVLIREAGQWKILRIFS